MDLRLTHKFTLKQALFFVYVLCFFSFPPVAQAYYSNLDVAELLKPGEYEAGLEPQYIFDNYPGGNFIGHFNMGATDVGNLKFVLGTGRTNLQGGAFYKIVPIPDYGDQPGIGIWGGVLYAYQNSTSAMNIRLHPEISKQIKSTEDGTFTPYAAIPVGIDFVSGNTYYPIQLAMGTRWLPAGVKNVNLWGEIGFELDKDGFNYISLGISIPFSDKNPFSFD
jgi:hypothetical protein